ncbi:MAG: Ribose-5-phosphate isomerase B [Parcubacteria group bacterium GW2011_GWA2_49_9]|nr:MAG: Ribose-5-phosphate isomerase B [Parcubacteria group bacterium GW2011_GWA2_49_9]
MKIYFAGDHAGFELKKDLMEYVRGLGHEAEDMGPFAYDVDDDYPDFVIPLAKKVASYSPLESLDSRRLGALRRDVGGGMSTTPASEDLGTPFDKGDGDEVRGIICAGSGQGEVMAANRVKGVRAAVYYGGRTDIVKVTREHNNANILSIGARFIGEDDAKAGVKVFLEAPFSADERHVRRLAKIERLVG